MVNKVCSRGHAFKKSGDCPVCPICWPKYYRDKAQSDFPELAAPALRALFNAKIKNLNALRKWREPDLAKLHGMGPNALKTLKLEMKKRKINFKKP